MIEDLNVLLNLKLRCSPLWKFESCERMSVPYSFILCYLAMLISTDEEDAPLKQIKFINSSSY